MFSINILIFFLCSISFLMCLFSNIIQNTSYVCSLWGKNTQGNSNLSHIPQLLGSLCGCSFLLNIHRPPPQSAGHHLFFLMMSGLPFPPLYHIPPLILLCHVDLKLKGSFPQMSRTVVSNSHTSNKCLKLSIL